MRVASGGTGVFAGGKIMPRRGSAAALAGIPRLTPAILAVAIFKNRRREVSVIPPRNCHDPGDSASGSWDGLGRPGGVLSGSLRWAIHNFWGDDLYERGTYSAILSWRPLPVVPPANSIAGDSDQDGFDAPRQGAALGSRSPDKSLQPAVQSMRAGKTLSRERHHGFRWHTADSSFSSPCDPSQKPPFRQQYSPRKLLSSWFFDSSRP
jgi:hypothetical protein